MGKPTPGGTPEKLFEDGDYYITPVDQNYVSLERNSVIIHPCPRDEMNPGHVLPARPFNITIVMPHGHITKCYYCGQLPSEALQTLYRLQNFDCFASDYHEEYTYRPYSTRIRKFPSRIM